MRDCLKTAVSKARAAGNAAAKEIVYSMSMEWEGSCLYGDTVANLRRTNDDIDQPNLSWSSIMRNLEANDQCASRSRVGAWNDHDMMVVGKTLPVNEDRAHFSLWCMVAAPLIAGNDLRNMSAATKTILTNAEMIAIDQDSLGFQGRRVKQSGNLEVWGKKLRNGDWDTLMTIDAHHCNDTGGEKIAYKMLNQILQKFYAGTAIPYRSSDRGRLLDKAPFARFEGGWLTVDADAGAPCNVEVYAVKGRSVAGFSTAGPHRYPIFAHGIAAAPGEYFCTVRTEGKSSILLVRNIR